MSYEISLTPTKDAYTAIKADVDENAAIKELVDNIIDNARRQQRSKVNAEIRYLPGDHGDDELVIRDDSGGLKMDELSMLFALGESEKDDIQGSIGAFGIGGKKALMRLGEEFTIASRHADQDTGYEYTIDQNWLGDDGRWTAEVSETEMESGTTELRIRQLNFRWQEIRDHLQTDLRETYALHLRGETAVNLAIHIDDVTGKDDEIIGAPPRPAFAYPPWDGLYPRRFEGIVLDPPGGSTVVHMDVTVGLLATGDRNEAGVDWICQDRVVEKANRDEASGFGDGLPEFDPSKHKRLKVRVELRTDGDASELPWNSDKSLIHARHPVTQLAHEWLGKIVYRYMKAGYGDVEPAFFEPYTEDDRYAAHNENIAVFNLRPKFARKRRGELKQVQINDKPARAFPQITMMQATAEAHAHLGIKYEYMSWVKPWMRPTYNVLVEAKRETFGCFETLQTLQNAPPDFSQDGRSGESERERLTALAQQHVNLGVRYTGLAEWEQPRYTLELEAAAERQDVDAETLQPVDDLPQLADEESESEDGSIEEADLEFAPFTEGELAVLADHLGPFDEYSPQKRKEVLVGHFRRLNMAGVRFEAPAD